MATLPVEILYGLYLGILIGVVPVLVAWTFGFLFKYVTGVTVPGLGVVVLSVAIAGASGGLLALADDSLTSSANHVRLTVALLVVLMGALYAHAMGDRLGAELPRRITLKRLTERTLSTDVVELVGGRGQVAVRVVGEVNDIEGFPPLPTDLRAAIAASTYRFPADLPLVELENRVADRLRTDHDLAEVSVRLDERARATVSAAPPVGGLSKRVPTGERAVSIDALVPGGLAVGDAVRVVATATPSGTTVDPPGGPGSSVEAPEGAPDTGGGDQTVVDGHVLGVRTAEGGKRESDCEGEPATDGGTEVAGGERRVTVAVPRTAAPELLGADVDRVVVRSRGMRREFELVALLRRAGKRFREVTVRAEGPLDGATLGEASVRDEYGVAVLLARRRDGTKVVAPRGDHGLSAGDQLVVVGGREALDRFAEAVA